MGQGREHLSPRQEKEQVDDTQQARERTERETSPAHHAPYARSLSTSNATPIAGRFGTAATGSRPLVICKAAATAGLPDHSAVAELGCTGVRERLGQLLDEPARRSHPAVTALNVIATAMVAFTLVLAAAVPTAPGRRATLTAGTTHNSAWDQWSQC